MILTGGRFCGRRLFARPGPALRPTPARVKEALFSILAPRIVDAAVLDLYAGSGALGLEALSRGAAHATFIEAHSHSATALKATIEALDLEAEEAQVFNLRVERAITRLERSYDLVFADPPYAQDPPIALFAELLTGKRLNRGALLIYEHAAKAPQCVWTPFTLVRREAWGQVGMSFLACP